MTITDACSLMEKYAKCPKCGCEVVGNGKGTVDVDTENGFFKRTCSCGWSVTISEDVILPGQTSALNKEGVKLQI